MSIAKPSCFLMLKKIRLDSRQYFQLSWNRGRGVVVKAVCLESRRPQVRPLIWHSGWPPSYEHRHRNNPGTVKQTQRWNAIYVAGPTLSQLLEAQSRGWSSAGPPSMMLTQRRSNLRTAPRVILRCKSDSL